MRSKANGMLQAVTCKGSRNENPSHGGEKMDCEILEVAARLLKDTPSAEYTGHTSGNATHGAAQWRSMLLGHASQAPLDPCDFWDSWEWYLLSGYEDWFCLCLSLLLFFFFNLVNFQLGRRERLSGVGEERRPCSPRGARRSSTLCKPHCTNSDVATEIAFAFHPPSHFTVARVNSHPV